MYRFKACDRYMVGDLVQKIEVAAESLAASKKEKEYAELPTSRQIEMIEKSIEEKMNKKMETWTQGMLQKMEKIEGMIKNEQVSKKVSGNEKETGRKTAVKKEQETQTEEIQESKTKKCSKEGSQGKRTQKEAWKGRAKEQPWQLPKVQKKQVIKITKKGANGMETLAAIRGQLDHKDLGRDGLRHIKTFENGTVILDCRHEEQKKNILKKIRNIKTVEVVEKKRIAKIRITGVPSSMGDQEIVRDIFRLNRRIAETGKEENERGTRVVKKYPCKYGHMQKCPMLLHLQWPSRRQGLQQHSKKMRQLQESRRQGKRLCA